MNEPTRITFNPAALTDDQRDGFTCVVCERDLATGGPSVPVGTVPGGLQFLGGQVFACASHVQDATSGERDDAERDDTREHTARRATWPGGEPAEVRDLAERHAAISDLSRAIDDLTRVIGELESAQASRDPQRLDQAVTQAGPVVQRACALVAEWERREL